MRVITAYTPQHSLRSTKFRICSRFTSVATAPLVWGGL
jgi:hypothetical protein